MYMYNQPLTFLIQASLSPMLENCCPRPCLANSSDRRCSQAFSLQVGSAKPITASYNNKC